MRAARKFAVALVSISLISSACSAPATTPATDTIRPTLAPSPSPAATATATASPTAPAANPQLEVVEWHRWSPAAAFEADVPNTYVEVLVHNPYDYAVNVYEPFVQLLNAGEVVHQTRDIDLYLYADAGWNLILPGESVPGRICACASFGVMQVPEWDSLAISADLEQADAIPYTVDLDIDSGAFRPGGEGVFFAEGRVTNSSGQALKVILLRVIVRDAGGHFVGSGLIGVIGDFIDGRYESLGPGSVREFSISAFTDPSLSDGLNFEVTGFGILATNN